MRLLGADVVGVAAAESSVASPAAAVLPPAAEPEPEPEPERLRRSAEIGLPHSTPPRVSSEPAVSASSRSRRCSIMSFSMPDTPVLDSLPMPPPPPP